MSSRKIYHSHTKKRTFLAQADQYFRLAVGVRRTLLPKSYYNIDEAAVVLHALLGTALGLLLCVLLLDLGCLTTHLTGTGKRSMDLSYESQISKYNVRQPASPIAAPVSSVCLGLLHSNVPVHDPCSSHVSIASERGQVHVKHDGGLQIR